MTLHEKGRAAIKCGDFSLALIMLLEAEAEFRYFLIFVVFVSDRFQGFHKIQCHCIGYTVAHKSLFG